MLTAGPWRHEGEARVTDRKMFLAVSLADLITCNALTGLGLSHLVWLLNLPATITLGRVASSFGGDALGLAVTIPAGAAIYGWVGARYGRRPATDRAGSGHTSAG